MGKSKKKGKRRRSRSLSDDDSKAERQDHVPVKATRLAHRDQAGHEPKSFPSLDNPLYKEQQEFLQSLSKEEREGFFSNALDPERRAEIWMKQADLGEVLINGYSWATPDDRAFRILRHFSPIVEVGCGRNAYWSRLMREAGIDTVAYDADPEDGGTIGSNTNQGHTAGSSLQIHKGGPEVLRRESGRTLFLCYPDEDDAGQLSGQNLKLDEPLSMAAACLMTYKGDHVIHVGELFGDALAMDQSPWGRSSSAEFQAQLASHFHCILKASLSNWLHSRDCITV